MNVDTFTVMHAFEIRNSPGCGCLSYSYLVLLRFIWRVSLSGYVINVTADSTYQPTKLHSTTGLRWIRIRSPFFIEAGKNAVPQTTSVTIFSRFTIYASHVKMKSWNSLARAGWLNENTPIFCCRHVVFGFEKGLNHDKTMNTFDQ